MPDAEALTKRHPVREATCAAQLMLALYRSRPPGGGARGLRRRPGDDWPTALGLEPGARLCER